MRDFNARFAQLTKRHVQTFRGGPLFERRYAEQELPLESDIEEYFFYCALQAVRSGLCARLGDYPAYNSFHDAASGIARTYKVIDWTKFNDVRRFNPKAHIKDFTRSYTLTLSRLPGYELLQSADYRRLLHQRLEARRSEIVSQRLSQRKGFFTPKQLIRITPGTRPRHSKTSSRWSDRPLVLSASPEARQQYRSYYFYILELYRDASRAYLAGNERASFPPGTYKPPLFLRSATAAPPG
jgi:hypothetical protein